MRTAWIVDAVRTAIGRHGGALARVRPDDLASRVIKALVDRTDVDPSEVTQLKHFVDVIRQRTEILESQKRDIDESLAELTRLEDQCTDLLAKKQKT